MTARLRRRSARGVVTAELAMTLPLLAAVTLALVWLLGVGVAQVRMVDAARETARAVARGASLGEAVALGERVAPEEAVITVRDADPVVVRVTARVTGPGGVFGFFPGVPLRAEAVAAPEPSR